LKVLSAFPWLPMRWMLPLLLITVSGAVIGGFWWFEAQRSISDIEQSTTHELMQDMHRLTVQLQLSLKHADETEIQLLLGDFSSEPGLQYALLQNPEGSISAATRLAWVGRKAGELGEAGLLPQIADDSHSRSGDIHLSDDRMTVWARFPLQYPAAHGSIRSDRFGLLIAKFDLSGRKQASMHRIEEWVMLFAVLVLISAMLLWLLTRHAITRRMNRLIATAKQVGRGNFSVRAGLTGRDELAQIGAAFDAMTEHLGNENVRLQQLSRAVEHMSEGVLITDAGGTIEYVNSAFTRITGYSQEEAVGQNPRILKSGKHPKEFYQALWGRISSGKVWKGRMTDRKKSGLLYLAKVSIAPLLDGGGKVSHYVSVQEDVSEQQKIEMQLLQAQKMESLGTLVGGIAHDFNNMLAGMVGNLYMARKRAKDMPEITEKLARVEKLSFRAADMIKQLLAFARKDMVQFKSIDLVPFIKEAFKLSRVAIPENILCSSDIAADPLPVECDATQLQQMLMNLLTNARDAVQGKDDPEIVLSLARFEPDRQFLQEYPDANASAYAMLCVEDNGCGIPENLRDRIFEPFFTTKGVGQGSGLGLSMLFGAMKSHRGVIELQSEQDRGSIFKLYFPLSEQRENPSPEEPSNWTGHGERLLLADDEPIIRETISEMLRIDGFVVDVAIDGQDAVEQFSEKPETYDAVILDVVMPRMGGMDAAHRMREIRPDIPVIFATGYDRDHVLRGVEGMQSVAALSKPLHSVTLRQMLGELLEKKDLLD